MFGRVEVSFVVAGRRRLGRCGSLGGGVSVLAVMREVRREQKRGLGWGNIGGVGWDGVTWHVYSNLGVRSMYEKRRWKSRHSVCGYQFSLICCALRNE